MVGLTVGLGMQGHSGQYPWLDVGAVNPEHIHVRAG